MTGKKYYKVVDRMCDNYVSIMVGGSDIGTNYPVGEFAYPTLEGSKLFVFDSLQAAIDFGKNIGYIFECEVINPVKYTGCVAKWYNIDFVEQVKTFWKNKLAPECTRYAISDTVLCDAVKITNLVYDLPKE